MYGTFVTDHVSKEGNKIGRVRPSVRLSVIFFEPSDL